MIDDVDPEWDDTGDDAVDEFDEDAEGDTLPCPDCGEEVYDDTDRCPHCGQWIIPLAASTRPSRALMWVVIVMIVLMVILAIS